MMGPIIVSDYFMPIFNLDYLDSIRFCVLFKFRYIRIKGYFHDFVLLELSHSLLRFTLLRFRKYTLYCVYLCFMAFVLSRLFSYYICTILILPRVIA